MLTCRFTIPYSTDKNLAEAYNREMELGGADYICFVDRDTIFLDAKFGHKITEIINQHPGNYFTCYTNRTNCVWQRWDSDNGNDIAVHTNTAKNLWNRFQHDVDDHTSSQLWSGHLMCCPVGKWQPLKRMGLNGLLGIDNQIHRNAIEQGSKVMLMKGIYIYHWYSNYDGPANTGHKLRDKSHLIN